MMKIFLKIFVFEHSSFCPKFHSFDDRDTARRVPIIMHYDPPN